MKQLKPFMFWVVCGVIVLIELGFLIFWQETDDAGHTPEQVKQSFDMVYKNLTDLYTRSQQHDPEGEFDAENHQDMKRLTNNFIITDAWTQRLQPVVDKYNQQREEIHADLVQRSACLHAPVVPTDDPSDWYEGYQKITKELLSNLVSAHALAIPSFDAQLDLDGDKKLRDMVGLYTKGLNFPDAGQHPLLSEQYTISNKIAQAVMKGKAKADPNPVLGKQVPEPQTESVAQMVALSFPDANQNNSAPKQVTQVIATPINVTLTLEGPVGALIAAEAEIENISEPVMIVRGGRLTAKSNWKPGERKGLSVDPMTCVLNITVVDFSLKPNAPTTPNQPGQPGRPDLAPGHFPNQVGPLGPPGLPGPPNIPGQIRPPALSGPPPSIPGQGPKP